MRGGVRSVRGYLAVVAIAILLITINIRSLFPSLFMAFHQARSSILHYHHNGILHH